MSKSFDDSPRYELWRGSVLLQGDIVVRELTPKFAERVVWNQ